MNSKADRYFIDGCGRCSLGGTPRCKVNTWRQELDLLRMTVLSCGLDEQLKWSQPCYTFRGKNVLLISAFKNYCAISFFKGALLADKNNILAKPGENSQAARQIRFAGTDEIIEKEELLKAYIEEAVEIEKAGKKIEFKKKDEYQLPEELLRATGESPALKAAFEALTPGRQRSYILYISGAKQAKTREARVEKCIPYILAGKGYNER